MTPVPVDFGVIWVTVKSPPTAAVSVNDAPADLKSRIVVAPTGVAPSAAAVATAHAQIALRMPRACAIVEPASIHDSAEKRTRSETRSHKKTEEYAQHLVRSC